MFGIPCRELGSELWHPGAGALEPVPQLPALKLFCLLVQTFGFLSFHPHVEVTNQLRGALLEAEQALRTY